MSVCSRWVKTWTTERISIRALSMLTSESGAFSFYWNYLGTKNIFYHPKFECFCIKLWKKNKNRGQFVNIKCIPASSEVKDGRNRARNYGLSPFTHALLENFRVISSSATKFPEVAYSQHKFSIFCIYIVLLLTVWGAVLILKTIFPPQIFMILLSLLHLALPVTWHSPFPPDSPWLHTETFLGTERLISRLSWG